MLVNADAIGLEWRTITELSGDSTALKEILLREDTHTKNQEALGLPSRLVAKLFLFRIIYRGSAYAFANDVTFNHVSTSEAYWDNLIKKFFQKYSGIDRVHQEWADCVKRNCPIIGPSGRGWSISMDRDRYGNLKLPWTKFTNYPVQGTGADIMMMARISFFNRINKLSFREHVKLISTVHDSIVVDTKPEYVQEVTNIFFDVFDDLPNNLSRAFDYEWKTPLNCEVVVGRDMKNMTPLTKQ